MWSKLSVAALITRLLGALFGVLAILKELYFGAEMLSAS